MGGQGTFIFYTPNKNVKYVRKTTFFFFEQVKRKGVFDRLAVSYISKRSCTESEVVLVMGISSYAARQVRTESRLYLDPVLRGMFVGSSGTFEGVPTNWCLHSPGDQDSFAGWCFALSFDFFFLSFFP